MIKYSFVRIKDTVEYGRIMYDVQGRRRLLGIFPYWEHITRSISIDDAIDTVARIKNMHHYKDGNIIDIQKIPS